MLPRLPVGERVRDRRRRLGRTQAVLAGLCGITTDYLSQIERGLKTPSGDVLARLAAELQVPVGTLLGDTEPERPPETVSGSSRVVQALLQRHGLRKPTPAGELRARVEHAWKVWQTSPRRFTEAEALLPDLIRDVEGTVRALRTGNDAPVRREALRVAADLYGLLRSYYRRTGRPDLSLMVADRALRAAFPQVGRPHIWASQLHMLFNRLGLAPDEERAVCRLAARTLLDRGDTASYFPDDHTSPDRQYLERSKFHLGREQDSAPLDVPARQAGEHGLPGGSELPLPAGPFPDTDLRTVMNSRVSRRGALTGPLDAASLGTLLWGSHASGHESVHRFADGGERLMRHRPYPSAGALYTAGIRLIALDVQGLAPGTYQCVPDRRSLRYVGPAPAPEDIRSLSSYLSRSDDDPDGIVPDSLPVVLGLYVDLGRLRERYGLRALRLGLLEAGHLAQSLLLTATALRLGTTTLGGFRDDLAHEIFGLDDLDQPLQYVLPVGRHPELPVTDMRVAEDPRPGG
ncbi:helix-turn-helix domain-containing protein [Streptomyces sp. MBT57]|nr:helix-turn-helix domain-containing protein [Streptomyces sp. MBT57]